MMYALLVFALSFFSITNAASIVNAVGPVTNLTISNRMIAPDGFLRSYVVFRFLVPSY